MISGGEEIHTAVADDEEAIQASAGARQRPPAGVLENIRVRKRGRQSYWGMGRSGGPS